MTERFIPVVQEPTAIVRDLASEAEAARKARAHSLLSIVDRVTDKADELTGTKEGHESWKRLAGFVGVIVGGTFLAGEIPNKDVAIAVSDGLAMLGGAFAGNEFRPISRLGRFNTEKFVKKLKDKDFPLDPQDVTNFFATFEEVLTEDDIKRTLLGRSSDKEDPRNLFIKHYALEYRKKYGKPNSVETRRAEKLEVKEFMDFLQLNGQTQRANKELISAEGRKRVGDIIAGVAVVGASAAAINQALNGVQGGIIGVIDEIVTVAVIFGSVALKKLDEGQRRSEISRKSPIVEQQSANRPRNIRILKSPHSQKDKRRDIGTGGHGTRQT